MAMVTSQFSSLPLWFIFSPGILLLAGCEAPAYAPADVESHVAAAESASAVTSTSLDGPSELWQLVGRSADSVFAVDEKSISRKENIVEATILTILNRPLAVSTGEVGYITSQYRYDCKQRTDQILSKVAFTVEGLKILEDLRPQPEAPVRSVSTSEQVWTAVCYGFRSGGKGAASIATMQRAYRKLLETNPVPDPIVPPS